jgi:RNA polymerase sigma-70 factor, ECF subfamily
VAPVSESIERELVSRFWERLRMFAVRRLGDAALAEDLAQEVLRRVSEALREGRVENVDALPAFVFQTATHLCLHHYRSRSREARALARMSSGGREPGAEEPDPLAGLVSDETRAAVRQALETLPPPDRDLLHRIYFDHEDTAELASRLGISVGAVRVRKHRALARLAELLGEWRL